MRTWCQSLALSAVVALLIPGAVHAQFFGGGYPYGGYGGWGGYGMPYGGYGTPYGGYGGWAPYFYGGSYVTPVILTYSTPAAEVAPRMRPTLWPAIPYRDTPAQGSTAMIDVRVPSPGAEVWFDGVRMQQSGSDRHFVTPPLDPGATYTFEVRASWNDPSGKTQTRTRQVEVRAGGQQTIDFVAGP